MQIVYRDAHVAALTCVERYDGNRIERVGIIVVKLELRWKGR